MRQSLVVVVSFSVLNIGILIIDGIFRNDLGQVLPRLVLEPLQLNTDESQTTVPINLNYITIPNSIKEIHILFCKIEHYIIFLHMPPLLLPSLLPYFPTALLP